MRKPVWTWRRPGLRWPFEADLTAERDAACAEAKRLSQQEADIAESAAMVEGEDKLIGVDERGRR